MDTDVRLSSISRCSRGVVVAKTCLLLGDDSVSILIEDHESELQLVVLASSSVICERYHEFSSINMA